MMYTNRACGTGRWLVKPSRYVGVSIRRVSLKTTMLYLDSMLHTQL